MQFFGSKKSVLEKKFSIFLRKMIGCVVHTLILSRTSLMKLICFACHATTFSPFFTQELHVSIANFKEFVSL